MTAARSGREAASITLDAVRDGDVALDDIRIHPDTLVHQAQVAEANANPQLAANLLRAAELTALPDDEVLAVYDALRPHRSTAAQLEAIAASLQERGAVRNAALVREAAAAYSRRGLLAGG